MKKDRRFFCSLVILGVSVFFLSVLLFESWGILVYADGPSSHPDSTHSVTLTPQQTLALYGASFTALVGDRYSDSTSAITFQYAFPLNSVGFMDEGGGFSVNRFANNSMSLDGSSLTANELKSIWADTTGLVYVADASQWNNSVFTPYSHDQMNGAVQLHVPFSISISGITRFEQNIFYSTKRNADYQTPYAYPQYNELKILTDIANVSFPSVRSAYSNYYVAARGVMPTYPYYQDGNQLDENNLGYFSGWIVDLYEDLDTPTFFSISGATIDCYCVSSVSRDNNNIWLIIGCPTLYNYSPPVVTTTRTTETYPIQTFPTETYPTGTSFDPHKIIIDNQNTQIMQLNLIIGQLDRIYNRMVNSGQIAVNLMPAEPLADLRTDIHSQIHDKLSSFTTSQIPSDYSSDMQHSFSFVNTMYTKFTSGSLSFFGWLGIFSLSMYVVIWFIFRGRG